MRRPLLQLSLLLFLFAGGLGAQAAAPLRLATTVGLSPDGQMLAFAHGGELWTVPTGGGTATRLTSGPWDDQSPCFSPCGRWIAFMSDRSPDGRFVYRIPAAGGRIEQLTQYGNSHWIEGWSRDGRRLYLRVSPYEDPFEDTRIAVAEITEGDDPLIRTPWRLVFDAYGLASSESPDGERLLFTRSGRPSSRRDYRGPAASQIWMATMGGDSPRFERISLEDDEAMNVVHTNPNWLSNDEILYLAEFGGVKDLFRRDLGTGTSSRVTSYGVDALPGADGVFQPRVSLDGSTLVYRYQYAYWHKVLTSDQPARKIEILVPDERLEWTEERTRLTGADDVAFTHDGKEMAFAAGGEIWFQDRILREPKRLTKSPGADGNLLFSKDGNRLYFVSHRGGHPDIWVARRKDEKRPWFLQDEFVFEQITKDAETEVALSLSPDQKRLAFVRNGELVHTAPDGTDEKVAYRAWDFPAYDWSPCGRYFVITTRDENYNRDIWIIDRDGHDRPLNISRHPDSDYYGTWSPDGKRIAWVGRRADDEVDVFYVNLFRKDEEETGDDRKREAAMKVFATKPEPKKPEPKPPEPKKSEPAQKGQGDAPDAAQKSEGDTKARDEKEAQKEEKKEPAQKPEKKPAPPAFEREGLHDRIHRIRIGDSNEGSLLWSPDGKRLYFSANIGGKSGYYAVTFPDGSKPELKMPSPLRAAHWLKSGELAGLIGNDPGTLRDGGKTEKFPFSIPFAIDWRERRVQVLQEVWRAMREGFYDPAMNNLDWEAVLAKYEPLARELLFEDAFERMVDEMLGELNASHMGYSRAARMGTRPEKPKNAWSRPLYDFGASFDRSAGGPGLLVTEVLRRSPASLLRSRIEPGERILEIEGQPIGPDTLLEDHLRLPERRELSLVVANAKGEKRKVEIWPMPIAMRRFLLYPDWVERTRDAVEEESEGRLGYLHIQGMNTSSLRRMEEDIYAAGAGRDVLLVDVRNNGGGSTADHVLTILCQPSHALTLGRRGEVSGYPQDRRVYATWDRPIVLLCNERSFSNAEILAHAIKTLGRGPVVGERTAGGVISTGGMGLSDGSFVRMPNRGWFVLGTGIDMELNGCMPDHRVPMTPEHEVAGQDPQLAKAIEIGLKLAEEAAAAPKPTLIRRSSLDR